MKFPVGLSWQWSYGNWIYNYLCNPFLSPLMLWVRISIRARCTTLCYKVCQWLATGWLFSLGTSVSSTNKTDHQDITEILLKVALNTIRQTVFKRCCYYRYIVDKYTWLFLVMKGLLICLLFFTGNWCQRK